MKPSLTVLTLGVDNLERALAFYRDGLGWETDGVIGENLEYGAVAFFDLQNGLKLALWPRSSISHDSGLPQGPPAPCEFTLGHNVNTAEEVDQIMATVENLGAKIVKPAGKTFWGGYAGYFQDPDQHLWEIVWNPDLTVES